MIFSLSFGTSMKLERLKVCLTETYSRVLVGKNLSDRFPTINGLKQGDVLCHCFSTLLIVSHWEGSDKSGCLKLTGTHQL
jgi:hypothetical protein